MTGFFIYFCFMKILLINTPRSPYNAILEHAPEEAKPFIHKKLIGPPLGLLTLAAALKNHDVKVFDTKGEYDLHPDSPPLSVMTEKLINEFNPDIVGTTAISSEFVYAIEILATAKKVNPEIITIIGGLHVTLCTEDCNHPAIDIAVRGHAGHHIKDIVSAIEKNLPVPDTEGIFVRTKEGLKAGSGKAKAWNAADENFLMPDRSLLNRWKSTYIVGNAPSPTTYVFTSLGCPYNCSFCSIWREHCGTYLQRNVESVISELKSLDYDIVRFADANTIVNTDFIYSLFNRIEEEGIKKEYIMDIRADTAVKYPELIEKLAKNGLKVVICGFESYKDSELKKYNKNSPADNIDKAINIFHNNEIKLRGNYVIPCDYSLDDFKVMADYAGKHKVAYAKNKITDKDLRKYNFFNPVLPTHMPANEFSRQVASLWLIKKGTDVI